MLLGCHAPLKEHEFTQGGGIWSASPTSFNAILSTRKGRESAAGHAGGATTEARPGTPGKHNWHCAGPRGSPDLTNHKGPPGGARWRPVAFGPLNRPVPTYRGARHAAAALCSPPPLRTSQNHWKSLRNGSMLRITSPAGQISIHSLYKTNEMLNVQMDQDFANLNLEPFWANLDQILIHFQWIEIAYKTN